MMKAVGRSQVYMREAVLRVAFRVRTLVKMKGKCNGDGNRIHDLFGER